LLGSTESVVDGMQDVGVGDTVLAGGSVDVHVTNIVSRNCKVCHASRSGPLVLRACATEQSGRSKRRQCGANLIVPKFGVMLGSRPAFDRSGVRFPSAMATTENAGRV
jgi:hypothetical protein